MMLRLDDQVFCISRKQHVAAAGGKFSQSLHHSGSQPMSCHAMLGCLFLEVGFDLSKVTAPSLALNPKDASQEALGEDAILHRSSGRPGEDKKKAEKMLGELRRN